MDENQLDKLAKEEFSNLNHERFNQLALVENTKPSIYIVSNNENLINKIQTVVSDLDYEVKGISRSGVEAYEKIEKAQPNIIFISFHLNKYFDGVELGRKLAKDNIPMIYICKDLDDLDSDEFLMSNYGFILESYSYDQIKFALEVAYKTHYKNIRAVEHFENVLNEKNIELIVEKSYSSLLLFLSLALIVIGIYTRNVTFMQWIIFIPAVNNLILAIVSLKKQEKVTAYKVPPYVSVFIPAHNEEYTIEATVRSIANMDYTYKGKKQFEIIVVNDGSTDSTGEILESLKSDIDNLRIITRKTPKSGKGKGFVLNDALVLSVGKIIGVFDADTRVDKNYLSTIIPYLNNDKVAGVQSRVRMYNKDENFVAKMQDIEFAGFGNVLRAKDNLGYNGFLGGNGQFTKKDAVIAAGKWDGFAVTEDLNLSIKIALNGGGVRYCPDVAIYQEAVTTWNNLFKQRTRWAIGNFETLFVYSPKILASRLPLVEKLGIISHVSTYAFNLFIFVGFLLFLLNFVAWALMGLPSIVRMDAPLIIGVLSAVAFLPGIGLALVRDDKRYLQFLIDLVEYWAYCFYLIPLFFRTMFVMITRRERTWDKTEHRGND